MADIIRASNIKKYFSTSGGMLHAVDDVSFTIKQGKTLGVVGESGCGKSTLGRVLIRLLEPTSGSISYEGKDITTLKGNALKAQRRNMQMIFQDPFSSLNPKMSVFELIAEPLYIHHACGRADIQPRVMAMMELVGLAARFKNAYPHELDGGRRQRIGIARALTLRPGFIVCDEPVSALDVSIQAQILNLMQDVQEELGLSYMFITHDLSVVRHISDEIIVMYLGVVVERCRADTLFSTALHPYTKALLSAIPIPDISVKTERVLLRGELSSPIDPPDACRFAPRCPCVEEICFHKAPTLKKADASHWVACHCVSQGNAGQSLMEEDEGEQ